ncbi:MAG: hypothetical protein MK085_10990 [Phycisphaerales bacterium]|nr:hypothetical protein [Phycisphaerales bacterium]
MSATDSGHGFDPILNEVSMHLVPPAEPVIGKVVSNEMCMLGKSSSFVRHIEIDVSGTPLENGFRAGQAFGVIPPGTDDHGKPHKVRLYSIASPTSGEDGQGRILSTTCKRLIDEYEHQGKAGEKDRQGLFLGVCSNYLCGLEVGTEVKVTGPAGKRFVLPQDPDQHDYVFMATGTGVAPFRGMVKDLFEAPGGPCKSEVHLIMGVPYLNDLLYDDLFRGLAEKHENFHYHVAVSRERVTDRDRVRSGYVHHYLAHAVELHENLLRNDRTLLYICGLAGMQFGVFQMLAGHGLGQGYLKLKDEIADIDPADWDTASLRRYVRPTHRCMLEVY